MVLCFLEEKREYAIVRNAGSRPDVQYGQLLSDGSRQKAVGESVFVGGVQVRHVTKDDRSEKTPL